jgi:restriction system protein
VSRFAVTCRSPSPAENFAKSKSNLRLVDSDELVQLIHEAFRTVRCHYKGLLPLLRIYMPEAIDEAEG